MSRFHLKVGLGTLLIVIAYLALTFALLDRDQDAKRREVDLSQRNDDLTRQLEMERETNRQLRRQWEILTSRGTGASWNRRAGLKPEHVLEEARLPFGVASDLIEELEKDASGWGRLKKDEIIERFRRKLGDPARGRKALELILAEGATPRFRECAAMLLGKLEDPDAAAALSAGLRDESPVVREDAVTALGAIGKADLASVAASMHDDPNPDVRRAAVRIAARVRKARNLDLLGASLAGDPSVSVRCAAAEALGKLGYPSTKGSLLSGLEDPSLFVRARCEDALETLGHLSLPLPDRMYQPCSAEEFALYSSGGLARRTTRKGASVYFEINPETRVDPERTGGPRLWYRAPAR